MAFSTSNSAMPFQHISHLKSVGGIYAVSDTIQQRHEQKGTWGGATSPLKLPVQCDPCTCGCCQWTGRGPSANTLQLLSILLVCHRPHLPLGCAGESPQNAPWHTSHWETPWDWIYAEQPMNRITYSRRMKTSSLTWANRGLSCKVRELTLLCQVILIIISGLLNYKYLPIRKVVH